MIRIAALTSGSNSPSSRLRIRQHITPLKNKGIGVVENTPRIEQYANIPYWPNLVPNRYAGPILPLWYVAKLVDRIPRMANSWRYQATWLERDVLHGVPYLEFLLKKPIILDVDDAIWLPHKRNILVTKKLALAAEAIIVGNEYLAEWFLQYSNNVHVIPTAIDTKRYKLDHTYKTQDKSDLRIGWIGTASNYCYLQMIESPLVAFFGRHSNCKLVLIAERPPVFGKIPARNIEYLPWSEENEVAHINSIDVGIMPLSDTEWTRGKCSYKMLQYMACKKPVIVSPVGMNVDVLNKGCIGLAPTSNQEWYDALTYLWEQREHAREMGEQGRTIIEETYASSIVVEKIMDVILSSVTQ